MKFNPNVNYESHFEKGMSNWKENNKKKGRIEIGDLEVNQVEIFDEEWKTLYWGLVGKGISYGGSGAALWSGYSYKEYHIWDRHGNYQSFNVPTRAMGVDLSVEVNAVLIFGYDFHVSDFYGIANSYSISGCYVNLGVTPIGGKKDIGVFEIGGSYGIPFSFLYTRGFAKPFKRKFNF